MKKVVVCYKWLLDDADIRVNEKSRQLDFEKAKFKLNEYDRNGIEAGVQVKAAGGSELIGVTCGNGVEASDSRATARTLAAVIKNIGDVDVVICCEASSDEYAQQAGSRVAAILGIPCVTYVNAIEVTGDTLKLSRKLDDGVEHVEVKMPAVISVVPDVNDPPIPSVKQILGAKKKPANAVTLEAIGLTEADLQPQLATVSVLAPVVERKNIRMNPDGTSLADAAANLVKQLAADGVL